MSVEGVNCSTRTDSATPPASNSSNEIEVALRGMEQTIGEDIQENYTHIHGQRMNTSSPLSCPSSPLSTGKISTFSSNSSTIADTSSSSRSLTVQNNHACQTVHISDWPTNVSGLFFLVKTPKIYLELNSN